MESLRALLVSMTIGMVALADDGGVPVVPNPSRTALGDMMRSGYRPGPRTTIQSIDAPSEFLVHRLVMRHFGELESCWNGLTSAQRPRSVEAKLKLTAGKDYKVTATLTPRGPLSACVQEWVSTWRLTEPTPEGSTGTVTILFSLK